MRNFILAIDQGTTSTRAILFDKNGSPLFTAVRPIKLFYPQPGWVEVDAIDIWVSVVDCISELQIRSSFEESEINCIGITNQRETTVIWDKKTGMPISNAIVWQSRQTADICDEYAIHKEMIHGKTGLLINPYFSATKIRYILDSVPDAQERAEKGELMFGTIDSWIVYRLTNRKVHATDVSNASRTLLFNINDMKWDEELCKLFNIPMCILPDVKPSSYHYGESEYLKMNIPICGVAGDQQSALFGQTCFEQGEGKNTYGTGCFMLMNTGETPVFSKKGLLTTVAWQIGESVCYALEGSVFIGGAVVHWLREGLHLIRSSSEAQLMALESEDTKGLYVVPAFVGLGTPYWDDEARGSILGITRGTSNKQIVRASLEGIAYQCKDVVEVMKEETNSSLNDLKVDGGATANSYLMQFQADILHTKIMLPRCLETTALGVAYFAGLCTGFYANLDDIKKSHIYQAIYEPSMKKSEIKQRYKGWKIAVKATRVFK